MRIYDPRLGRFLSVDPITKEYPELTPYQFAGNSPIANIDLDGLEPTASSPLGWEAKAQTITADIIKRKASAHINSPVSKDNIMVKSVETKFGVKINTTGEYYAYLLGNAIQRGAENKMAWAKDFQSRK